MKNVLLLLSLLIGCCGIWPLKAQQIDPPFGLSWFEDSARLEQLLVGAGAKIVKREHRAGRDYWTVEGLIQPGLKQTRFGFVENSLIEIELQYEQPQWDAGKHTDFLYQVRRRIEQKLGEGKLIVQQKEPVKDVIQTLVGYQWDEERTVLQLFYFAAEHPEQAYRTVSLHYRSK